MKLENSYYAHCVLSLTMIHHWSQTAGALCQRDIIIDLNEDGQNADAIVRLDSVVEARKPTCIPVN